MTGYGDPDKKKTVLVDMDGVLVDLLPTWLQIYGEQSGDWIHPDDVCEYNFEQFVEFPETFYGCLDAALRKAPPMLGSSGFQNLIEDESLDVFIVTYAHGAAETAWQAKLEWLERYFPDFDRDRVIFTKHKYLVQGDVLVEDSESNAETWQAAQPYGTVYIIDQPYNCGMTTFDEVVDILTTEEGT